MGKAANKQIGLLSLILIASAFVTSIRNLPTIAETGAHMFFFGIVAALGFFIPVALVSAELSSTWPERGGIYVWAKNAFGRKMGFLTIFLQWAYVSVSMISILYFISGTIAFLFAPALAENRIYLIIMNLAVIWFFTYLNLKGIKTSSKISMTGFAVGVALPGLLIIVLGIVYLFLQYPIHMNLSFTKANLLPDFNHLATLVLVISFVRAFAGIEAVAVYGNYIKNPAKNFPIAMFFVVIIALVLYILGSLSVAIVIPQEKISLVAGLMDAFKVFFSTFHLNWLVPILALLVTCGQMGSFATWLMGPVTALEAAAENGDLPPFCRSLNKNGAPYNLLIIQSIILSITSIGFLALKTVNIAFWISVAISMLAYSSVYIILYLTALKLRYKNPTTDRPFRIWGNYNSGMWICTIIGIVMMVFCMIVAFIPPKELPGGNAHVYEGILLSSMILFFLIPYIILKLKKPSWNVSKK